MRLGEPTRSAIGLLKLLLAASLLIPILLFVVAAWLNYHAAIASAERELLRSSEVGREQAAKIFDGQSHVADRVNDLVRGLDAATIAGSEKSFHEAFATLISRMPQVQSVMLASKDGDPLVSAGTYPVPHVTLESRDYFRAVMDGYDGTYVSSLQVGDVNRQLFFGAAQPWRDAGGALKGVIDVAVAPSFFQDFYAVLIGEGQDGVEGKVITLIRDDGQILVRYPPLPGPGPFASTPAAFLSAIHARPNEGLYESRSIVEPGRPVRIFAYRQVQGYPLYVVAGRSRASIIAGWRRTVASHLIFGVPVTLALCAVAWTALVRTQREMEALARANREIERRERAEATLLKSQRLEAVGQMTGGVAHDFNNLLTVILGSAELLGKRAEEPARVRNLARQIILAAQHGGKVTQQLLTFSRRQLVHPELVDLNELLQAFRPLLERAASEAVTLAFDLAAGLRSVVLDPGHFEAALLNLVGNARDAIIGPGTIRITTGNVRLGRSDVADIAPGEYVRVGVADTGSGMGPHTAARAFEPFFTTKEIGKGTGLGLSQVYGFAKQAGGEVRILTAPGEGTTVEIFLPCAREGVTRPAKPDAPQTDTTAGGKTILVVEDDMRVRDVLVEALHELGYVTLTAGTAQAALERLQQDARVDLLLSDIVMPGGMTGVQLSAAARQLRPGLPVLLTSGYAAGVAADGAADVALLMKPYDRETLARSLHAVLQG